MIPCAACFNRFKSAQHHLEKDKTLRAEMESIIGAKFTDGISIRNPIDIIANDIGLDALAKKVVKKLEGLKPVSYYGCLLLRPPEVCEFDDYENPVLLDKILTACGADVKKWSFKTDCCGGSLSISRTDIVGKMVNKLASMAKEAGANCIVTACPLCMGNLDMRTDAGLKMPVFYFTELLALAMGLPGPDKWFKIHITDPMPLVQSLKLM
jgi:heterodisulfide reductase subunit B